MMTAINIPLNLPHHSKTRLNLNVRRVHVEGA